METCDRCGPSTKAAVRVTTSKSSIYLCGHCYHAHKDALSKFAVTDLAELAGQATDTAHLEDAICGAESVEEPVRVCVLAPHTDSRHEDGEGLGFYMTRATQFMPEEDGPVLKAPEEDPPWRWPGAPEDE